MKISQNILEILEKCRIEGNILYLPPGQLDRTDYEAVNKCLTNIGGEWNRTVKGHVFDNDPSEAFENMLLTGETTDMKKIFQFFPTPRAVAGKMCDLAELTKDSKVLEPSVGKGGIADVIWERGVSSLLGVELNQDMKNYLDDKPYTTMVGVDFLVFAKEANERGQRFTHIIMNPPFSKQQEIEHIMAAFKLLAPGGILVSVLSTSPFWRTDTKSQAFRDWIDSEDSFEYVNEIDLPKGTFKESGTMIPTKIIKIRREGILDEKATTAFVPDEIITDVPNVKNGSIAKKAVQKNAAKLMKIYYYDTKSRIRLECFADTVVIEKDGKLSYIAAVRLSGYPESVRGMSDAIYGGGAIKFDINGEQQIISGRVKQYQREISHDGLYAEAVLWIRDEELRQLPDTNENNETNSNENSNQPIANNPRKCYMFCGLGDKVHLFKEVDKKTSVPLIPEFREYVLSEFQNRGILKPLQVISSIESFDAWVFNIEPEEKNIIAVVNDGLRYGKIAIPGANSNAFPAINGVTQYLNTFGVKIAERIKEMFKPLFDPATEKLSQEVLEVNEFIKENAGYRLYDAQLAVVESLKRGLERGKFALCIAECGSGKTKIGTSALHAYQQRLNHRQRKVDNTTQLFPNTHTKHFNIVLSPSHMAKKWVREIEETLPETFAVIVNSITELNTVYNAYERDNRTCYVIITKEKARDGYMLRPAAVWNNRRGVFVCPHCNEKLEMDLIDCGTKYRVPADPFFFRKETKQNRKCEKCKSLLWTVLAPEQQTDWIKVSDYGFVHRRFANRYLEYVQKKAKIYDAIEAIVENPDRHFPNAGAYRRFALSTYIKNKMKGKIDGLIVDELHDYNNNSGQGDAMGELYQVAKKFVGMTATLINGYSSGIFHLLFRIASGLMIKDHKSYEKPIDFNYEYGVTESVYEIEAPDYNANRRTAKRKVRERQLPGVSPLVYTRYLLENAAFLSLMDMGKDLPEYEEIPVPFTMRDDVAEEYDRIESQFVKIFKYQREIAKKVLSVYLNLLIAYPDQPYGHEPVNHPVFGEDSDPLIVPKDLSSIDELHEKDEYVLELTKRKIESGERVLIYTSWTRLDTQAKLSKLLTAQGYNVAILTTAISPKKREEWVEKQVSNGAQILITNPSLVETGLDLNDFTTIIYYNVSYKLFTLRQSSRRSWRINQRAPKIEVYFFYYEDTMQQRAITLMASKLAVAGVIEGNLTDEGLAAMSDCQDMTTALARELTQGIEGEVEDLGDVFKRMASLRPVSDVIESEAVVVTNNIANDTITVDTTVAETANMEKPKEVKKSPQSSGLLGLLHKPKPTKRAKKKNDVLENQMSLFDMLDTSA